MLYTRFREHPYLLTVRVLWVSAALCLVIWCTYNRQSPFCWDMVCTPYTATKDSRVIGWPQARCPPGSVLYP